jgi:tRNA(Ile2) C34 agmatinyltransferase TiaS
MPLIQAIDTRTALDSLRSTVCPACGKTKGNGKTLCMKCFCKLPGPLKERLYRRIGNGYEVAVRDALNVLGASELHLTRKSNGNELQD